MIPVSLIYQINTFADELKKLPFVNQQASVELEHM
jgi:hypothetical protein